MPHRDVYLAHAMSRDTAGPEPWCCQVLHGATEALSADVAHCAFRTKPRVSLMGQCIRSGETLSKDRAEQPTLISCFGVLLPALWSKETKVRVRSHRPKHVLRWMGKAILTSLVSPSAARSAAM